MTYKRNCEHLFAAHGYCEASATYRYPTHGGGYMYLCTTHARPHLPYCEGADGYRGRWLQQPTVTDPDDRAEVVRLREQVSALHTTCLQLLNALGVSVRDASTLITNPVAWRYIMDTPVDM
jgi:hypothetical protein